MLKQLRDDDSLRRCSIATRRLDSVSHRYTGDAETLWLALQNAPHLEPHEILRPHQVKRHVDRLLLDTAIAYWSGGLDGGIHHWALIEALPELIPNNVLVLLGVEPDSYIHKKGRSHVLYQEDRLRTMARLLKKNGKLAGAIFYQTKIRASYQPITMMRSLNAWGFFKDEVFFISLPKTTLQQI